MSHPHSVTTTFHAGTECEEPDWCLLVAQCEPRIAAWCRRFGLQDSDAADISQNVLIKMLLALRSKNFDANRGHLLCWLKVVTDNSIRSFLWKAKTRKEHGIDATFLRDVQSGQRCAASASTDIDLSDSDDEFLTAQLLQAESCVQPRVKPQTWEAYRLTMHENLSPAQTAAHIGISVRDVYVAKCRVVRYLRRQLGF